MLVSLPLSYPSENNINANEFTDVANRFPDSSKLRAGRDLGGRSEQRPPKSPNCHCYHFLSVGMLFLLLVQAVNLSLPVVLRRAK